MTKVLQKQILDIEITRHDGAAPIMSGQLSLMANILFFWIAREVTVCHIDSGEWQRLPISQPANALAVSPFDREVCVALAGGDVERYDLTMPHLKLSTLKTRNANRLAYDEQGCVLAVCARGWVRHPLDLHTTPFWTKLIEHRIDSAPLAAINLNRDKLFGVSSTGRLFVVRQPDALKPEIEWNGNFDSDWDCYAIANHTFLAMWQQLVMAVMCGSTKVTARDHCSSIVDLSTCIRCNSHPNRDSSSWWETAVCPFWDIQCMYHDFSWNPAHGKVFCARQTDTDLLVIWG